MFTLRPGSKDAEVHKSPTILYCYQHSSSHEATVLQGSVFMAGKLRSFEKLCTMSPPVDEGTHTQLAILNIRL